jgi:hypothetical protein
MSKASDVTVALMSVLFGAIIWFVLQVIIGVVAWVSIIAGGAVAVAGVLMAAAVFGARSAKQHGRHHGSGIGVH